MFAFFGLETDRRNDLTNIKPAVRTIFSNRICLLSWSRIKFTEAKHIF